MEDGSRINYDYLVVAAGIQIDWGNIPGLPEGLSKDDSGVVSIYDYNGAGKTHRTFENVIKNSNDKPRNLLSTMSSTGIKMCWCSSSKDYLVVGRHSLWWRHLQHLQH
jgi:sulfide:quinone oxidoreductase